MVSEETRLPAEAQAAWDAYQVMGKSKVEYFSLLQEIDQKYKQGGSPSIAENLQLEKLLTTHSEKVAAFNAAMQAVTDKEARELLLKKLMGGASPPGMH
jgi:hypothetical protein